MTEMALKLSWLLYIPPLLAVASVYLLLSTGLEGVWTLVQALRRRFRGQAVRAINRVMSRGEEKETTETQTSLFNAPPKTLWWGLGAGVALAALWRHPLLSPWFIVIGGVGGWTLSMAQPAMSRDDLYILESFVGAFRNLFAVNQSVFNTLHNAAQDLGEESALRKAIEKTVQQYHADTDAGAALEALHELDWPHLSRLATMLSQVGQSDADMVEEALQRLEKQIRRSRRLRDRAKTVLTLTRITLRVLQAANATALIAASLVPLWRTYYVKHPPMIMVLTAMMVGGSWYFSNEVSQIGRIS